MQKLNRDYITQDVKNTYLKHLKVFKEIQETINDNRKRYNELVTDRVNYSYQRKQELLSILDGEYKKLISQVTNNVNEYIADIKEIKKDSSYKFNEYYSMNGNAIDTNTYSLLEKGLLTDREILGLYDKFKDNKTMLRVIAKYTENNKDSDIVSLHNRCINESRSVNEIHEAIDSSTPYLTRALGYNDNRYLTSQEKIDMSSAYQNRVDDTLQEIANSLKPVTVSSEIGSFKYTYSNGE